MITRHGIKEVAIATILLAIELALINWLATAFGALWWLVAVLPVAVWVWVIWFFRDPQRPTPEGEGLFISPADGCVADITPLGPDSALGREGVSIGVFMNVFSVHVNRMPCDGKVEEAKHVDGAFLDARDPKASEKNESATVKIIHTHDGQDYPILIRQIAGLIARRIVTPVEKGQDFVRGQRYGMIKFGSRVELLLPKELAGEVAVKVGQNVQAGLSILAKVQKGSD